MATKKIKEQKQARALFIETGKTQKSIAEMLGVAEKTVSRWVNEGGWETERNARLMVDDSVRISGKLAMENNFQMLIELQNKRKAEMEQAEPDRAVIADLDKGILQYTHAIAQANKGVQEILKGNRITVEIYIQVMDDIFNALMTEDSKLHAQTLDFQQRHIQFICKKLG